MARIIFLMLISMVSCQQILINPVDKAVELLTQYCDQIKSAFHLQYMSILMSGQQPNVNFLQIYLVTENGSVPFTLSTAANDLLNSPYFNKSLPVVIYTHGFLSVMNSEDNISIKNAFLTIGGYNILEVDTKDYIYFFYLRATTNVIFIGEYLGQMLAGLYQGGVSADNIHLIGFSLGAHISGIAGEYFKNSTGKLIARITGLDPASPCFLDSTTDRKLSKYDATFVDVIHTNGGLFGMSNSIGDVDFFPNGGSKQPLAFIVGDSHFRAWQLYASSIVNPAGFFAIQCDTYDTFITGQCSKNSPALMGFAAPKNITGNYFIRTSGKHPYYLGYEGINSPGPTSWIEEIYNFLASYI